PRSLHQRLYLQTIDGYTAQYGDTYMIVLNGSTSTTTTPTPTPTPSTIPTRYEQNSPAVQLTGSWYPNSGAFNSGGSSVLAMDAGSNATFTFIGTAVSWIGYRDPWSGIAQVYLDGTLKGTVDTYSANTLSQTVTYALNGLTNTNHTLT